MCKVECAGTACVCRYSVCACAGTGARPCLWECSAAQEQSGEAHTQGQRRTCLVSARMLHSWRCVAACASRSCWCSSDASSCMGQGFRTLCERQGGCRASGEPPLSAMIGCGSPRARQSKVASLIMHFSLPLASCCAAALARQPTLASSTASRSHSGAAAAAAPGADGTPAAASSSAACGEERTASVQLGVGGGKAPWAASPDPTAPLGAQNLFAPSCTHHANMHSHCTSRPYAQPPQ